MNSVGGGRKSALSMQADGIAEVGGVGDFLDEGGSGVMLVSFRVRNLSVSRLSTGRWVGAAGGGVRDVADGESFRCIDT